jgi:hypothetical protein
MISEVGLLLVWGDAGLFEVDARNKYMQSGLHLASRNGLVELVEVRPCGIAIITTILLLLLIIIIIIDTIPTILLPPGLTLPVPPLQLLLSQGADVNALDEVQQTPLDVAASFRHDAVAVTLRAHGAVNSARAQRSVAIGGWSMHTSGWGRCWKTGRLAANGVGKFSLGVHGRGGWVGRSCVRSLIIYTISTWRLSTNSMWLIEQAAGQGVSAGGQRCVSQREGRAGEEWGGKGWGGGSRRGACPVFEWLCRHLILPGGLGGAFARV